MNVKLRVLTVGVIFFTGASSVMAQQSMSDTAKTRDIEEVVVMGYVKRKATEITGNAVRIGGEDIATPSAITVDQALQGKAPGLVMNTSSGSPGAVQNIRIRGIGSFSATNEPLYVIDGVPVITGDVQSSTTSTTLSSLAAINNQDIESIVVLKDASATAAYGARGSNGVILITTKRGRSGKAKFNFNTTVGFQNDAYTKRNPLTGAQKLELLGEGILNQLGGSMGLSTIEDGINVAINNGLGGVHIWDADSRTEYNWPRLLKNNNAAQYTTDFSVSGGSDKTTFYASLGYNRTEATVVSRNPFERITGTFNFTRQLTDKLKMESSFNGSWITQNPILEQGGYFSNPFVTKILMSPWARPYNADGTPNIGPDFIATSGIHNTMYTLHENLDRNNMFRGLVNTKLDYQIVRGLTFSSRFNLDFINTDSKGYQNRHHGDGADVGGAAERTMSNNYTWVSQNSLNYNFSIDKHQFDVTGLFEYQKNQYDFLTGYGENLPADGLTNLASTSANFDTSSSFSDWQNASYLGMLNYTFDNRLVLDGTFRREGSSRFAPGLRFGTFWSVGAAYHLHKDIFQSFFNQLTIRGSYGVTGNSQVTLNSYQATLNYDADYAGNGAAYPGTWGNPLLTWEKNKTYDAGLNFAFLNSRISGSVAYFHKTTYDLLQAVPMSRTTGFTSQVANIGEMINKGIEVSLEADVIRSNSFNWSVFANFATLDNEVTKLALDGNGNPINPSSGSVYRNTEVGESFSYWFMPTWAGVNEQTGAPEWYLNEAGGERTSNYNAAQRHNQGTPIPKYTGGFGTNISFKNFFVNANFYFAGGHKVYEQYAQWYMRTNNFTLVSYNGADILMDRWQKPGDITDIPKMNYSANDNFHATSSRWLYDGTFLRMKDLSVGYNLGKENLRILGLEGLTFTVRGTNLFTWTKDKNLKLDPETPVNGYTSLTTPPVKSVIFGVNVKF